MRRGFTLIELLVVIAIIADGVFVEVLVRINPPPLPGMHPILLDFPFLPVAAQCSSLAVVLLLCRQ